MVLSAAWDCSRARRLGRITKVSVQLNHTIVSCRDQQRSAAFLAGILGLPAPARFAHFLVVEASNNVSLDFAETTGKITPQHYAFLVGEEEFDAAFGRIRDQDLPYWADPGQTRPGVINHRDGGRGLYFEDPDGHMLEIITRPYGSGGLPFPASMLMTEPEGDGHQRDPDEKGDAVRDDQHHVPGCYPVGNPQQESGQQDHEIAEGYILR